MLELVYSRSMNVFMVRDDMEDCRVIEARDRLATLDRQTTPVTEVRSLTGGQALVQSLLNNGVDTIFGLPGVQLDGAFDALYDERDRIRVIHTRHEQATAYMADGYARTTGKIGACLVVPGPGLLNASAALSTAYACNSPVLCVTGQIQSDLIEFGRGLLHEIPNQLGMIRSVTKQAERAITPPEIPGLVNARLRGSCRAAGRGRSRSRSRRTPSMRPAEVELLAPAAAAARARR